MMRDMVVPSVRRAVTLQGTENVPLLALEMDGRDMFTLCKFIDKYICELYTSLYLLHLRVYFLNEWNVGVATLYLCLLLICT